MINISRANTRDNAIRTVNGRDDVISGSLLGGGSIEPQKSKPNKNFTISGGNYKTAIDANSSGLSGQANHWNLKYNEEDGFMRGARIAEKIQEFHSNGTMMPGPGQPVIPIQLNQERQT